MSRKVEVDLEKLSITAVVAGDFEPKTQVVARVLEGAGVPVSKTKINETLTLAKCVTGLRTSSKSVGTSLQANNLEGLRTMMPGEGAINCRRFQCPLINSCIMSYYAQGLESISYKLDESLARVVYIRI